MKYKFTKTKGIYYLYKDNKVVYVGQSNFCEKRIFDHNNKNFDEYQIIELLFHTDNELNDLETIEIIKYKPLYNITLPKNNIFISANSLLKKIKKESFNINHKIDKIKNNGFISIIFKNRNYFKVKDIEKIKKIFK